MGKKEPKRGLKRVSNFPFCTTPMQEVYFMKPYPGLSNCLLGWLFNSRNNMKSTIIAMTILFMAQSGLGQQHQPTYTLQEYTVTFDADVVEIIPAPEAVSQGVTLTSPSLIAAESSSSNISVETVPGVDYSVRMMGRSEDPANPNRAVVVDSFNIALTPEDEVRIAWRNLQAALKKLSDVNANFDLLFVSLNAAE